MRQGVERGSSEEQGNNREVGYCKPPREHQFKPGQSGNPQGRPVGTVSLRTLLKEKLAETSAGDERRTYGQVLVDETFELALSGSAAALRLIWEYMEGKPSVQGEVLTPIQDDLADACLYDDVARDLFDDWLTRVSSDESRALVRDALVDAGRGLPARREVHDESLGAQSRYDGLVPE